MNRTEYIGKLNALYVGDKNCLEELITAYDEKDKEIERLNNIINKLETGIENMWVDNTGEDTWEYEEEACLYREEFLDKIKELKGSEKSEI